MDLESYNERVDYLRSGVLPSHVGARHQRYRFKQTMKKYSLDHCLRLLFGSRRVLHVGEVDRELKLLHEELGHCNRDEFIRVVQTRFSIVGLRGYCRANVTSCVARLDDLIGFRVEGPMVRYTEERRKDLCRKFGIPWARHFPNVHYPCLDVVRFKPDTLDTRSTRNCLCSALSAVLSGTLLTRVYSKKWCVRSAPGATDTSWSDSTVTFLKVGWMICSSLLPPTRSYWPVGLALISFPLPAHVFPGVR